MKWWNSVVTFLQTANLRIVGMLIGALLGLLFLLVGFWKTLIFAAFIAAGYGVGRWIDTQEDWRDVIERITPNKPRD
ncbi:DUF2273 domain-containing protein [Effusibacillus dendaii]|uniref:DUF2273 domain-containing protein n=1 Tax=Effusibacillus dendaii TaxID=2743772 RepID=A0A7I8D6Z1_9BACL|nr:DUF2273 domain-containing protein [Effusibacillus dendaii]BCJ85918.1 hypothetical protein skT53_09030 [Effusibacillus dendaii]